MRPRTVLFVGNFFLSLFTALIGFVLLPYLSSFVGAAYAGFIIAGGALVAVVLFPLLPHLVARHGAQRIALIFATAEMAALFAVALFPGALTASLLLALAIALQPLLSYELDLLLEGTMAEEGSTGRVRTLFITAWNLAALTAPLLVGALLADTDAYGRVFLAAGAALVPFVVLFATRSLPQSRPIETSHIPDTLVCIARDRDLAVVTFGHFLLYAFLAWVSFYIPFFLHSILDIPWMTLGWMFALMLLPYSLIEYPAGWFADRVLGDKELMFAGFIIAGGALASLGLLSPDSPIALIVLILLASRVGAALIESMTESHFFRRVSERDVNSISVFRGVWPLANLVALTIGSIILLYGNYQLLFALTGGFTAVAGAIAMLFIKDFR